MALDRTHIDTMKVGQGTPGPSQGIHGASFRPSHQC